jgi:hypothetical protein
MQAFAKHNDGLKWDNQLYWQRCRAAGFSNTQYLLHNAAAFRKRGELREALSCVKAAGSRPFKCPLPKEVL